MYTMSWPRSRAPDSDCRPMSYVPPSPPNATNFSLRFAGILPCFFSDWYIASTPLIVAAAFSNALWTKGFSQEVYG